MSYIVKEVIAQRDGNCKPYNCLSHDVVTWDVDCDVSTAQALPCCSGEFWFFERSDSKLFPRRFAALQVSRCVSCSLVSTLQEFRFRYPVDIIRVKSYVDGFLDSSLRESRPINFTSLQGGRWPLVGVLRNGGGLGTGWMYISLVFFHPLLHGSSRFTNIDFAAFTGNPVNLAVLSSWIDSVLCSYWMGSKCRIGLEDHEGCARALPLERQRFNVCIFRHFSPKHRLWRIKKEYFQH